MGRGEKKKGETKDPKVKTKASRYKERMQEEKYATKSRETNARRKYRRVHKYHEQKKVR